MKKHISSRVKLLVLAMTVVFTVSCQIKVISKIISKAIKQFKVHYQALRTCQYQRPTVKMMETIFDNMTLEEKVGQMVQAEGYIFPSG